MPPLKRKLVPSKEIIKNVEVKDKGKNGNQSSEESEEDWLSEVKDDAEDSTDEENDPDLEGSDEENDPGPVFVSEDEDEEEEDGEAESNEDDEEAESDDDDEEAESDDDEEEEVDSEEEEEVGSEAEEVESEEKEDVSENNLKEDSLVTGRNKRKGKNLNNRNEIGESSKNINNEKSIRKLSKKLESSTVSNKTKAVKSLDKFKNELKISVKNDSGNQNEYEHDSSDEEDIRNTVGNIPMNWYDEYPHLGYDWDGKKILKPKTRDQLDEFLRRMEDPNFWRTVKDSQTGQDVVLSDADMTLIERMQKGKIPDADFDQYAPWVEWFTSEVMKTPIRKFPEHKRSFLPSKIEKDKVSKLVHALKMGWIKTEAEKEKERQEKKQPKFYMLWGSDDQAERMRRIHDHIPAPKRLLPGHAESYNPPKEYLFDKLEMKKWKKMEDTPSQRKLHFLPQKFNSLREVPAYGRFVQERFNRCLDLYLCPRGRKMKLMIEPEDLVPQLPSPKDLQPFPTVMSMVYKGHTDMVRTIDVDSKGQFLISGSDDTTVKVWEISTGRCMKTIPCGGVVRSISWCPSQAISLIVVAADRKVLIINPGVGDSLITSKTDTLLEEAPSVDSVVAERVKAVVQWENFTPVDDEWAKGIRIVINHFKEVTQVSWHGKGDYFTTVMPDGQNRSVLIHQLSKRRSQIPFSKSKGLVQCVLFHPIRPFLFVATQRNVRIYDLVKQELFKKLITGSQWISTMAIHPGGDNILVGTYDRKVLWFDLDLSTKPYQTLRLHSYAVRGVAFHKRYPLFASGSDDRGLIVCHGMVYNDLLKNALIVPLKRLSDHDKYNDFGVFDVKFHPMQPWVFSSGADSTIRLYT